MRSVSERLGKLSKRLHVLGGLFVATKQRYAKRECLAALELCWIASRENPDLTDRAHLWARRSRRAHGELARLGRDVPHLR
jgi:hypothetical protein